MFSTPTKFLVIILALLQLIAPLVHAHTNEEISETGYHLPGLEHYHVATDLTVFKAIEHHCVNDCSIISIGAGIKHKKESANNSVDFYLVVENFSFTNDTYYFPNNSPPFQRPLPLLTVLYALSPPLRAPPSAL